MQEEIRKLLEAAQERLNDTQSILNYLSELLNDEPNNEPNNEPNDECIFETINSHIWCNWQHIRF